MEFTITSTSGDIEPRKVLINTLEELMELVVLSTRKHRGIVITDYEDGELPNIEIYDDNREECMNCACR